MSTNAPDRTCPRCESRYPVAGAPERCDRCGLDLATWGRAPVTTGDASGIRVTSSDTEEPAYYTVRELFLSGNPNATGLPHNALWAIWSLLVIWNVTFLFRPPADPELMRSFMHTINLVFHEAGHVLFRLLGEFMTILGGSLFQLIVPMVVGGTLLVHNRDPFGASIALWWLGQSMMDLAPYIDDARRMTLPLLGGGTGNDMPGSHDWNNILGRLGMLKLDHTLAWTCDGCGRLLMIAALLWGAAVLKQHSNQPT